MAGRLFNEGDAMKINVPVRLNPMVLSFPRQEAISPISIQFIQVTKALLENDNILKIKIDRGDRWAVIRVYELVFENTTSSGGFTRNQERLVLPEHLYDPYIFDIEDPKEFVEEVFDDFLTRVMV